MMKSNRKKWFTMIEMVVVIVIIATLAAGATPLYFEYVKKSQVSAAKLQIGLIEQAIFNFRLDTGKLPDQSRGLENLITNLGNHKKWKGPYLKGGAIPPDPWGNEYVYKKPGDHGEFDLISYGADGQPGGSGEDADIGNWTEKEQ